MFLLANTFGWLYVRFQRVDLIAAFCFAFCYMIIGLTSFWLYNNMFFAVLQYGILYKVNKTKL